MCVFAADSTRTHTHTFINSILSFGQSCALDVHKLFVVSLCSNCHPFFHFFVKFVILIPSLSTGRQHQHRHLLLPHHRMELSSADFVHFLNSWTPPILDSIRTWFEFASCRTCQSTAKVWFAVVLVWNQFAWWAGSEWLELLPFLKSAVLAGTWIKGRLPWSKLANLRTFQMKSIFVRKTLTFVAVSEWILWQWWRSWHSRLLGTN